MPYTREELERVIAEGGSVMLPGGHVVTDRNHLPSQDSLDQHHKQVEKLNAEAAARYPELRPEVMFPANPADEPPAPDATKAELQDAAEARGIDVPADATKSEIKDALKK